MHPSQRLINHVALVLDGSLSMNVHKNNLIRVADEQIKHLALRSEELRQETRVSVYLFNSRVECLIFDMDVMRLPSIADLYRVQGMTALIDATLKSQRDLETTSQLYGDHAFLSFVLTDGEENSSTTSRHVAASTLQRLGENWTVAFLVPDNQGVNYVKSFLGVPAGNIAKWDTASAAGVIDAAKTIRSATDNFMAGRAKGVRGTRDVFSTGLDAVNRQTVAAALDPMDTGKYNLYPVASKSRIDEFVKRAQGSYTVGKGYYQLTKTETIQPQKNIVVVEKSTGKAYHGADARPLIGLPNDRAVRVRPDANPLYDIFVQSTSLNRNLMPNTRVLVFS